MGTEIYVFFISMLPFIELRGSVPVGIGYGLPFWEVYLISVIGNIVPILPILILFQPISKILMRYNWYQRMYQWLYKRTVKKGKDNLDRYGALGLMLFTAVPLPTTGAWTAAFLATFFQIKIKYAFPAIAAGVIIAGFIVGGLSQVLIGG